MSAEQEIAKQALSAAADGGPFVVKNLIPTLWMLAMALFGGVVSFIQKVRTGKARALNLAEFVGEMLISGFVGIVTYWICAAFAVNPYLTAAGVAISGHMGARAIFLIEQFIENRTKKMVP